MRYTLFFVQLFQQRLLAVFTLACLVGVSLALPQSAMASCHGGEASSSGAAAAVGSGAVLAVDLKTPRTVLTDSLWGNLLLSMAYQRDAEVQKYVKRLGRVNTLTFLSIAGISGLGLAQSIVSLSSLKGSETLPVMGHDDGDSHVHTNAQSRVPATLGVIGSGTTVLTLGIKAILDGYYSKRLSARQALIQNQMTHILDQFEAGDISPETKTQLTQLVGQRATKEFLQLWEASHQNASTAAAQ
jgi:hypothetical protein